MHKQTSSWIGIAVGSSIGGYVPTLWGAGLFSISGLVGSVIGAFIGLYIGFKISQR